MKLIKLLLVLGMLSLAACGGEEVEDSAAAVLDEAADSAAAVIEKPDEGPEVTDPDEEAATAEEPGTTEPEVSPEEQAVIDAFDAFGDAVVAADSDAAVTLISPESPAWGDEVLEQTLTATEAELLESLPFSRATVVVLMRTALEKEQLLGATSGMDMLRAATDKGVLAAVMSLISVGDLKFNGNEAFSLDGNGVERMRFARTADDAPWLFDIGYSIDRLLADDEEEATIRGLTTKIDGTRTDFFDTLAAGYEKSFADVSAPLK